MDKERYFNNLNLSLCSAYFSNLVKIPVGRPVGYFGFTPVYTPEFFFHENRKAWDLFLDTDADELKMAY